MSDAAEALVSVASVAARHPCLAGHFPGRPVVPGVVILDHVRRAAEMLSPGERVIGIEQCKFTRPLRPDQAFQITLTPAAAGAIGFECRLVEDGTQLAKGRLRLGPLGSARP